MAAFGRFVLAPLLIPVPVRPTVARAVVGVAGHGQAPVAAPAAVGVNVTLTVQEPPTATGAAGAGLAEGATRRDGETVAAAVPGW